MAIKADIQDVIGDFPVIDVNRRYWFIRTHGGDYYEEFYEDSFIAIGYNEVLLSDIHEAHKNGDLAKQILSERIKAIYKENELRPGLASSQLLKFVYEIKKGDVIIIPSDGGRAIALGIVGSTPVYLAENINNKLLCPYAKRKRVTWQKIIHRQDIDPALFALLYTRQAISDASKYDNYIDRILTPVYIKNDIAHITLKVLTTEPIDAEDLFGIGAIIPLTKEFVKEERIDVKIDNIDAKVGVQSKGVIEFLSQNIDALMIIGALIGSIAVALAGGGNTTKLKGFNNTLKTDGLISKISDFLAAKTKNDMYKKIVENALQNMKIETPADLVKILDKLNKKK